MRLILPLRIAALSCVLFCSEQIQAQVVISQVYGGGGNSGSSYRSDFIELHNTSTSTVNVDGWSVQYASASGSSWQVSALAGSIAAGGYYLIKQADGSGGSVDLPSPDTSGGIAMSSSAGKVALSSSGSALSGSCPSGYADLLGYGSNASCAEGSAPGPAPSNTLAVLRADDGCGDSNNNAADFVTGTPTPRNSASTPKFCDGSGQPVASLTDLSLSEGNTGNRAFVFTLSLSQPAGSGGASFNVATRDGSAAAGSDYQAVGATTISIAEGLSSAQISVEVFGDSLDEDDETFYLDISQISGALPQSLTASATILNDDFERIAVHSVQGTAERSPLEGQVVAVSGIVTGRRSAGFFLQTPDAEADADPRTSEGIYVYTRGTPPADAAVGNRVSVRGTVIEYVPSSDPAQPPLTEIGNSPTVLLDSTGNALPTPVELSLHFPDPRGTYDQLERLEGMRITVASLTVNTPTGGSVSESSATATSDGVFHAVVTGQPRAWREPGAQLPDPLPADAPNDVPRWNTNPEVIAVGSSGVGGERIDVAAGCRVLGATGPLDYGYRRYTLYPESAPQVDCEGVTPSAAPVPQADDISVATYNLERFFDDVNDPAVGEAVLTSNAYQGRLNKASLAIRDYLHLPDIIGAVEVESQSVLQTLAERINQDVIAAGNPDPQYAAYLIEGNDVGGIDVGFLVKQGEVAAGLPRVQVEAVSQHGKDVSWSEPSGAVSLLNDRPPLLLEALVNFADGRQLPLSVIVVHQRSLNGALSDDDSGTRVRAKRHAQAEWLANLLQARQLADPAEQLVVMGDFNAYEFNDGYVDAMGSIVGRPSPDNRTVISGDGADLVNPDYYDLTWLNTPDQSYSYGYDGNVQSLDHIIANQALMRSRQITTLELGHARINADFPQTARNDFSTPTRLSDHDPALLLLRLKPQRVADLGVTVRAVRSLVYVGESVQYRIDIRNRGPYAAEFPAIGLALDALVTPTLRAAPGWDCQPVSSNDNSLLSCTSSRLGSGHSLSFTLSTPATSALAGSSLNLAASVRSQSRDPQSSNDDASAEVRIQTRPGSTSPPTDNGR